MEAQMQAFKIAQTSLLLAALSLSSSPIHAAVSPFTALAGAWTGGGTLSTSDGMQERLRCRASYNVSAAGEELRLNLRCASASYNFDLTSEAQYRGGAISGSWSETSRNASGSLSGRAGGGHIEVSARGQNFSAELSLTTRGNRQLVAIHPQGTNITAVSLELARR
jgi:hypothetical protein